MASTQQDEIEVLLSIYPNILSTTDVAAGLEVKLDIAIELERERTFEIVSSISTSDPLSQTDAGIQTTLSHLPAVLLTVLLPLEYPATVDPVIRGIYARHAWLAPALVRRLGARLEERWREAVAQGTREEGILWPWVEDIQTGAFLDSIASTPSAASSSSSSSSTAPLTLPHPTPKTLYAHLMAHQSAARAAHFSAQAFTCGICLTPQRGARCVQLPCEHEHVFCLECLKSFWGLCVSEGEVGRVTCPGVECVKEKEKTEEVVGGSEWEDVVRRVLSDEEVERWKWLRIKQAAERDPNTVPCPVRMCQAPVPRPKAAAEDESGWTRLRTCDACGYAFCVGCRRTWHGPVTRCAVTRTAEFMEAYIALEENDPRRRTLEVQYGKKNLERMAQEYTQEKENEAWLKEKTMACPGCETHVEKSQGCNHMTCARCAVHFCFRCGTKLRADSPYKHYEQTSTGCYGKLFDYDANTWEPMEGDLLRFALE